MLEKLYDTVYFAAELRAQKKLAGAQLSPNHEESLGELKTTSGRIRRFFGLPDGSGLYGVAQNFLFWRSDFARWKKVLWGVSLLVIVPVQISLVVLKCLRNILKLVTEFLPLALAKGFYFAFTSLKAAYKTKRFFAVFFGLLTGVLFLAFGLCYLIGRATTSPVESVRASYEFGEKLGDGISGPKSKLGLFLGVLLAGLSVALTACVYAVLFPLAIKFLLVQTAVLVSSVPHWLMSTLGFVAKLGSGFGQFLFANVPLSFLIAFNSPILFSIMAGLSLVGITLFGGVASVGAVIDKVTDPGNDDTAINRRECIEFITSGEQITSAEYRAVFTTSPGGDEIEQLSNTQDGKIPAIEQMKVEL